MPKHPTRPRGPPARRLARAIPCVSYRAYSWEKPASRGAWPMPMDPVPRVHNPYPIRHVDAVHVEHAFNSSMNTTTGTARDAGAQDGNGEYADPLPSSRRRVSFRKYRGVRFPDLVLPNDVPRAPTMTNRLFSIEPSPTRCRCRLRSPSYRAARLRRAPVAGRAGAQLASRLKLPAFTTHRARKSRRLQ